MPDLSKLSTEELLQLRVKAQAPADLSHLSTEELLSMRNSALETAREKFTPVESGAIGVGQGLTFGFGDEGLAALKAAYQKTTGDKKDYSKLYRENQKAYEQKAAEAEKDNPASYIAGNIGGAVGGAFVPGINLLAPAKGAGLAANVGRMAIGGALAGAGESRGDLGSLKNAEQVAQDALTGGVIGAGAEGLGAGAGRLLSSAPEKLKELAAFRAFKAASGQNKKAFKEASKTDQLLSKGATALERDEAGAPIVGLTSATAEEILPKAEAKAKFYGDKIGSVATEIDKVAPKAVSGEEISQKILDYAASIPETETTKPVINKLMAEAENYAKKGNISFADAQKLKNTYKFKAMDSSTHAFGQEGTNKLKSIVGDQMDETASTLSKLAEESGDINLAEHLGDYKNYKTKYGAYATFANAAEERKISNQSNRFISPSDYLSAGAGLLYGADSFSSDPTNPLKTAALFGAGNRLLRNRSSAVTAKASKALADFLEKGLQNKVRYGATPLAVSAATRKMFPSQQAAPSQEDINKMNQPWNQLK